MRYHPNDKILRILKLKKKFFLEQNVMIHDPKKIELSETLNQSHLVVGIRSGAVFESSASNIITFIFNNESDLESFFMI